jgi:hypothetical protein
VTGSGYNADDEGSGEEVSVENVESQDVAGEVAVTPNLATGNDETSDDEEIVVCSY